MDINFIVTGRLWNENFSLFKQCRSQTETKTTVSLLHILESQLHVELVYKEILIVRVICRRLSVSVCLKCLSIYYINYCSDIKCRILHYNWELSVFVSLTKKKQRRAEGKIIAWVILEIALSFPDERIFFPSELSKEWHNDYTKK